MSEKQIRTTVTARIESVLPADQWDGMTLDEIKEHLEENGFELLDSPDAVWTVEAEEII